MGIELEEFHPIMLTRRDLELSYARLPVALIVYLNLLLVHRHCQPVREGKVSVGRACCV